MKTFSSVIFLFGFVHFSLQRERVPNYRLSIRKKDVSPTDVQLPSNPFATQCGGSAELLEQRNTLCANPKCKVTLPNHDVLCQMDLTFSRDIPQLGWRHTITLDGTGPTVDYDGPIEHHVDGPIIADTPYLFQARVTPTPGIKSRAVTKYEFYDMANKTVDLCVEAKYQFV